MTAVTFRRPDPSTVEAVRASCALVADRPALLAEAFYAHLFEMAPGLRPMFPVDMTGQMQKMSETLLWAVAQLGSADNEDDVAEVEAALVRLGATHRTRYGVETEHYGYIGHALTRAVKDIAGARFSGGLSSAWIGVYQWVAAHMIAGADAADDPSPDAPELPTPRAAGVDDQVSPPVTSR